MCFKCFIFPSSILVFTEVYSCQPRFKTKPHSRWKQSSSWWGDGTLNFRVKVGHVAHTHSLPSLYKTHLVTVSTLTTMLCSISMKQNHKFVISMFMYYYVCVEMNKKRGILRHYHNVYKCRHGPPGLCIVFSDGCSTALCVLDWLEDSVCSS